MVDVFRSMLDELMGKERDVPLAERSGRKLQYDDPEVCKHQLAGLCPYQLFRNTRSDLGKCEYSIHDDHLEWPSVQAQYDELSDRNKDRLGFEEALFRLLERSIRDMDRKIDKAKERAAAESRPKILRPEDQRRLDDIQARIKECQERAEVLGEQGDVDNALHMTNQADNYRRQHDSLHTQLTQPERIMTVCEVCGVFISTTTDDTRRMTPGELRAREDHLNGKQYLGWKRIREFFDDMKARRLAGTTYEPRGGEPRSSHRSSSRDHERERDRYEGGSGRGYERERERDRYEGGSGRGYERGGYERERGGRDAAYERERERSPRRSSRDRDYHDRRGGGRERERDYDPRRGSGYGEVAPPRELYGRSGRDGRGQEEYDYRR